MAQQKTKEPQRGLRGPGSNCHEGLEESEDNELDNNQEWHSEEDRDGPSVGRASKRAIRNVEEGRAYLATWRKRPLSIRVSE